MPTSRRVTRAAFARARTRLATPRVRQTSAMARSQASTAWLPGNRSSGPRSTNCIRDFRMRKPMRIGSLRARKTQWDQRYRRCSMHVGHDESEPPMNGTNDHRRKRARMECAFGYLRVSDDFSTSLAARPGGTLGPSKEMRAPQRGGEAAPEGRSGYEGRLAALSRVITSFHFRGVERRPSPSRTENIAHSSAAGIWSSKPMRPTSLFRMGRSSVAPDVSWLPCVA